MAIKPSLLKKVQMIGKIISHDQGRQYGTVRSEFAYYVPCTLNRTMPAYRASVQFLKRTVPAYRTF